MSTHTEPQITRRKPDRQRLRRYLRSLAAERRRWLCGLGVVLLTWSWAASAMAVALWACFALYGTSFLMLMVMPRLSPEFPPGRSFWAQMRRFPPLAAIWVAPPAALLGPVIFAYAVNQVLVQWGIDVDQDMLVATATLAALAVGAAAIARLPDRIDASVGVTSAAVLLAVARYHDQPSEQWLARLRSSASKAVGIFVTLSLGFLPSVFTTGWLSNVAIAAAVARACQLKEKVDEEFPTAAGDHPDPVERSANAEVRLLERALTDAGVVPPKHRDLRRTARKMRNAAATALFVLALVWLAQAAQAWSSDTHYILGAHVYTASSMALHRLLGAVSLLVLVAVAVDHGTTRPAASKPRAADRPPAGKRHHAARNKNKRRAGQRHRRRRRRR